MSTHRISPPLVQRFGHEATIGLMELLESERVDWTDQVLSTVTDRFERRLMQEISAVRIEFHADLAGIREEIATSRVEYLKWSFVFWIGQVAVIAGLLAFMFRVTGR